MRVLGPAQRRKAALSKVQAEKYWPETNLELKLTKVNLTLKCVSTQKIEQELTKTVILLKGDLGERVVEHIHVKQMVVR